MKPVEKIQLQGEMKNLVHNKHGRLLNMFISGADLYGWRSEGRKTENGIVGKSDYDIRGIYIIDTVKLLGLRKPRNVIEYMDKTRDLDVVFFEIGKAADLALKGNCNVLEELTAPQIYNTSEFQEFRSLIKGNIGKAGVYKAYRGLAHQNFKKFILPKTDIDTVKAIDDEGNEYWEEIPHTYDNPRRTVKKYLYVARGLLAGRYFLETNKIEPNMLTLAEYFKEPLVLDLIELKKNGLEDELIPPECDLNDEIAQESMLELFQKLDNAYEDCDLPNKTPDETYESINKFIIDLRKGELQ